ncbi:hypothetical protein HYS28_00070 [Candidatus Uhrbacteria bacterium]|nr:hypothetical protein [Candidatus Uhrbacteria bacterium]
MILCIDGSDINHLGLATYEWTDLTLSDNGWRGMRAKTYDAAPEGFLAAIMDMVQSADEIDGIVAVVGPGSATALRTSVAIANTIAFARNIPLYGVPRSTDFDSIFATAEGPTDPVAFLAPVYETEARITPSKKDQLRRDI